MKIAIAQLNYTIGDFEGNRGKIVEHVRRAKKDGAHAVFFAEQAVSGRPAYDLLNDVVFLEKCNETLAEIAAECKGITAVVGLPLQIDNCTISAAAVIHDGKISKYIGKQNVMSRDERYHIGHSKGYEFVRVDGKNVAVVIGSDILVPEQDFGGRADLVVSLKSSRYARGVIADRHEFYSRLAFRTHCPVAFVNQVGGQTDIVYYGSSAVFGKKGETVCQLNNFQEDYAVIDMDAENPPIHVPEQNKTANVYEAVKLGLKDYFAKNGFRQACVGLSGGIDSAVVAALAAEVLGPENVRALMMPSQFSSDHSVEDAVALAENLGIRYDIVPITEIFGQVREAMAPVFGDMPFDVTEENMQSRIRGLLMMSLSNKYGCVVLNTSNKSEIAVGYGTLYGDTIGALSLLGDIYKTEVYDLARYINRKKEVIPVNTLQKAPSAELRPEQKDSDSLPLYDVLDAILYRMIEENQGVYEIIAAGFDNDTVKRVYRMFVRNGYKRYQFCPVLRMSTCTMRKDRILPLTYDTEALMM